MVTKKSVTQTLAATATRVHVGIGGWNFAEWRGVFYPEGLVQAKELEYASRKLTAIEINATFYRLFKREHFARWRDQVPDDFVFTAKATRYATHRRVLAEAGESIERFVDSGITALGHKLGPIVWQLAATHRFNAEDMAAFLSLLPRQHDGVHLRHAIDARHESFRTPEFVSMARQHEAAIVYEHTDDYSSAADITADFVYARLMKTQEEVPTGYAARDLTQWASRARDWASGAAPNGLPYVSPRETSASSKPRDVFAFFISGAKVRAPAAALALIKRLQTG